MDYYHKEPMSIYKIGPVLLIMVPLVFLFVVRDVSLVFMCVCILLAALGAIALIVGCRKGTRVWVLKNGVLKTPDAEIDLSTIKSIERDDYNEEIYHDIQLKNGDTIRSKPPYLPWAERKLMMLLKSISETNLEK